MEKLKNRALGITFLSLAALLLFAFPTVVPDAKASHGLCGAGGTFGTDSWSPAQGVYVSIAAIACGSGRPTFTSTRNEVQCSFSGSFTFGNGHYEFQGFGGNEFSKIVDTTGFCPNDRLDFGPRGVQFIATTFSLTVTYQGQNRTLFAEGSDCAQRFCPV